MSRSIVDGGRHAAPSGHRRGATVVSGLLFALTPWLTVGFGTPIAFLTAAVLFRHRGRRQAVIWWVATAVYTAAVLVMLVQLDAPAGTAGDVVLTIAVLVAVVGGGMHALVFVAFRVLGGHLPGQPATPDPADRPPTAAGGSPKWWVLWVVLSAFAVGLVGFWLVKLVDDVEFSRHHETTTAVVVSIRETRTCLSNQGCTDDRYPTVEFTTAEGEFVRAETHDFFQDRDDYTVGRSATVHYDPEKPRDVRLRTGLDRYDVLIIMYIVAGAGFGVWRLVSRVRVGCGRGRRLSRSGSQR